MPTGVRGARVALAMWLAVVSVLLLLPFDSVSGAAANALYLDKIVHAVLFGVLAWLATRSLWLAGWSRPALTAALFAASWGALLELMQTQVLHRGLELADMAANAVGAVVAAIMAASRLTAATLPEDPSLPEDEER